MIANIEIRIQINMCSRIAEEIRSINRILAIRYCYK